MTFYELLKDKAMNPKYKDEIIYVENFDARHGYHEYVSFTYKNLLDLVEFYIEKIKNSNCDPSFSKKFVIANQSIASIAAIIALLECNFSPVLIDAKACHHHIMNLPYVFDVDLYKFINPADTLAEKFILNEFKEPFNNINDSFDTTRKLYVCTSGSEGNKPHFVPLTEESLVNSALPYGENNGIFYSYISCANISGILTNIVNPLLHDMKVIIHDSFDLDCLTSSYKDYWQGKTTYKIKRDEYVFSTRSPYVVINILNRSLTKDSAEIIGNNIVPYDVINIDYHTYYDSFLESTNFYDNRSNSVGIIPDTVMLPRDIIEQINSGDFSNLSLQNMKKIYLAGGNNTKRVIDYIRSKIPSIPEGVFVNLYGATEAGGVICSCPENKLKVCYISVVDYEKGEIVYTFDKKNFYKIKDGKTENIVANFDDFDFSEYIPVSESIQDNINVDSKLNVNFKDISTGEWITAGDLGIYIDNQLYILGRKSLIMNLNGKSYFLNAMEDYFTRKLGVPIYCIKVDDTVRLCIEGDEKANNFPLYSRVLNFVADFDKIELALPVLEYPKFYKSTISGKISRKSLEQYSRYALDQYLIFKDSKNYKKSCMQYIVSSFKYNECEIIPDYEKFQIKVKLKNRYLFPKVLMEFLFVSPVLIDDDNGEYIFEVNEDFLFRDLIRNMMDFREEEGLVDLNYIKFILPNIGVSEDIVEELRNYDNFADAYKPVDKTGEIGEVLRQTLINAISKVLSSMEYNEAQEYLKTLIHKPKAKKIGSK